MNAEIQDLILPFRDPGNGWSRGAEGAEMWCGRVAVSLEQSWGRLDLKEPGNKLPGFLSNLPNS